MKFALLVAIGLACFSMPGCSDDSAKMIAPPEGAKVLTDEERAEFNKNAEEAMIPKE